MSATVIPFASTHRSPVSSAHKGLPVSPAHESRARSGILTKLQAWRRQWRERRLFRAELWRMPDDALADFGLTRRQPEAAVRRPVSRPSA